jgi:hypothetical protein
MPPLFAYEDPDGVLEISDGVTRATRIAKLALGETVPVIVIGRYRRGRASSPRKHGMATGDTRALGGGRRVTSLDLMWRHVWRWFGAGPLTVAWSLKWNNASAVAPAASAFGLDETKAALACLSTHQRPGMVAVSSSAGSRQPWVSQRMAVPSRLPVRAVRPSGEKPTAVTSCKCPFSVMISCPVVASHTMAV